MKTYKFLPLAGIVAMSMLLWAGCGSPSGRVRVAMRSAAASATQAPAVDTYDVGDVPARPYREIAYLSYDAVPGEFVDVLRQFQAKARELGADAIILNDPVSYTGEEAYYGRLMFRATAVAYQNKGATAKR